MIKKTFFFFVFHIIAISHFAYGADIASEVQNAGDSGHYFENGNGGYLELGFGAGYVDNPLVDPVHQDNEFIVNFDVAGSYQYGRFFFEASQATQDGVNLGINIYRNKSISFEVLLASIHDRLSERNAPEKNDYPEAEKDQYLLTRSSIYSGSGIRFTHYFGSYITQYRLVTDTFSSRGLLSTLRFGRGWQIRNWNIIGILSAEYTSADVNDYWFGITEREQTARFSAYKPESSIHYTALMGVTYPISENWVFRSYAGYVKLPDTVVDSPLLNGDDLSLIYTTINYVF